MRRPVAATAILAGDRSQRRTTGSKTRARRCPPSDPAPPIRAIPTDGDRCARIREVSHPAGMVTSAFDIVLRDATVAPGDSAPIRADVAVRGGRIAVVGRALPTDGAAEVVDASGMLLCPGFVDVHAHSALEPFRDPRLRPKVAQGFTTEIINPDGLAPAPVAADRRRALAAQLAPIEGVTPDAWTWETVEEYLEALAATRPATSLIASAGHNALREFVAPRRSRPLNASERAAMRAQIALAVEAGARAVSLGLVYPPGMFADADELLAVAEEAARCGVPLTVHLRNEAAGVLEAAGEMVDVARRSGAALHLSHLKAIGPPDLLERLVQLVDRAAEDLDVTFDVYPYGAGSGALVSSLPPWAQAGDVDDVLARVHDADARARIRKDVERGLPGWENPFRTLGAGAFVLADVADPRSDDVGKTLERVAEERSTDTVTAAMDLLVETSLAVTTVEHFADERVVRDLVAHPRALIGSDGIFARRPHPRLFGTAAKVLGRYALSERLLPLQDAVSKLSARAADRFGLFDRGRIAPGKRADLVLLDPGRYVDLATYERPTVVPDGVVRVLVAGATVWPDTPPATSASRRSGDVGD